MKLDKEQMIEYFAPIAFVIALALFLRIDLSRAIIAGTLFSIAANLSNKIKKSNFRHKNVMAAVGFTLSIIILYEVMFIRIDAVVIIMSPILGFYLYKSKDKKDTLNT